uniref:Trehalose-6-phosphate phosphatase (EC) n=1 Tax=Ganoderma boninense TaxID=34458 RepID=A0A5K1K2K1_9APHY|nr:Trehalose-6-phosphate phosphatase (EC [Ganoderma boninense]
MSFTYELSTPTQTPSSTQAPTHLMTSTPTTQDPASEFQPPDISRVRQWCERLADYYRLEPLQLDDLKQLANLMVNVDEGLIKSILWQQTTLYRILNRSVAQGIEYQRFEAALANVEELLGTSWKPSKDQELTIRVIARDMLVAHDQRSYTNVALDVKERLMTVVRKKSSNGRTTMRELLILSIAGKGKKSLEDTTWEIVNRFKKGGAGTNLSLKYQFRICMLRAWTYEDYFQGKLPPATQAISSGKSRGSELDPSLGSSLSESSAPEATATGATPLAKKRKVSVEATAEKVLTATVGKVPKGEDFFSKMDARLDDLIAEWGHDMSTQVWRDHLTDLVLRDRQLFGVCTSGVLPSIPVVPAHTVTTTVPSTPSELPVFQVAGPSGHGTGDILYEPTQALTSADPAITSPSAPGPLPLFSSSSAGGTAPSQPRTSIWD